MSWSLSRFRTGDLVEIRGKDEILASLDRQGSVDGMAFMPEMLQYCGQRVRVSAVAHKTCETVHKTWKARRLETAVHLTGLRCDGSAHGGCQAYCNLFWKDAWLKPVEAAGAGAGQAAVEGSRTTGGLTEAELFANTQRPPEVEGEEPRYSCQATRMDDATQPLAWWNPHQYLRDVLTGNRSLGQVIRVLWFAFLKQCYQHAPRGRRLIKRFREQMHWRIVGRDVPEFQGTIGYEEAVPTGRLDLQPGERVRIKPKDEIVKTIQVNGNNRGLYYDVEMSRYCGTVRTVRTSVSRIIDELTGRMRHMKHPCIMLEGVVCNSEYSECRLLCPRGIPSYWREIWLERVESDPQTGGKSTPQT